MILGYNTSIHIHTNICEYMHTYIPTCNIKIHTCILHTYMASHCRYAAARAGYLCCRGRGSRVTTHGRSTETSGPVRRTANGRQHSRLIYDDAPGQRPVPVGTAQPISQKADTRHTERKDSPPWTTHKLCVVIGVKVHICGLRKFWDIHTSDFTLREY